MPTRGLNARARRALTPDVGFVEHSHSAASATSDVGYMVQRDPPGWMLLLAALAGVLAGLAKQAVVDDGDVATQVERRRVAPLLVPERDKPPGDPWV